jgi:hypothetical protein
MRFNAFDTYGQWISGDSIAFFWLPWRQIMAIAFKRGPMQRQEYWGMENMPTCRSKPNLKKRIIDFHLFSITIENWRIQQGLLRFLPSPIDCCIVRQQSR